MNIWVSSFLSAFVLFSWVYLVLCIIGFEKPWEYSKNPVFIYISLVSAISGVFAAVIVFPYDASQFIRSVCYGFFLFAAIWDLYIVYTEWYKIRMKLWKIHKMESRLTFLSICFDGEDSFVKEAKAIRKKVERAKKDLLSQQLNDLDSDIEKLLKK